MKRFMLFLIFFIFGCTSLFAGTFTFTPKTPLFKPFLADYYAPVHKLQIGNFSNYPHQIYTSKKENDVYYVKPWQFYPEPSHIGYIFMKTGTSLGVFRYEFDSVPITLEASLRASISVIFIAKVGFDMIGMDGNYFFGITADYDEWLTLSFGFEHFSGHYGDEILEAMYKQNPELDAKKNTTVYYYRQDPLALQISVKPHPLVRVYGTMHIPYTYPNTRPVYHEPVYWKEKRPDVTGTENYHDWQLQAGFEARVPTSNLGDVYLATDMRFFQWGKVQMRDVADSDGYYAMEFHEDAPWLVETALALGLFLTPQTDRQQIRVEISYTNGRIPITNFLLERTSYWSFGFTVGY